jgi:hypothetical protein
MPVRKENFLVTLHFMDWKAAVTYSSSLGAFQFPTSSSGKCDVNSFFKSLYHNRNQ